MAPRRNGSDKAKHGTGRRNGSRPVFDHAAAFAFYATLGPERSFVAVAAQFGVSDTTIRKWAHAEGWEEKVAALDEQARQELDRRAVRSLADRNADTVRLVDRFRSILLAAAIDDFDLNAVMRAGPRWLRLEQLIEGEATDRISVAEVQQLQDAYHSFIVEIAAEIGRGETPSPDEIVERLRDHMTRTFEAAA